MLRTLLPGLALVLASCGCKPAPAPASPTPTPKEPTMTTSPALSPDVEVRTAADRDAKSGEMVEVFGTYQHAAGGKAPDAAPDGHAAVRLDDGTQIWLQPPWHADAIRSADEIARYDGKAVVAKGLLMAECPPPPDGRAYAKVPCLTAAIIVMERRAYDALKSGELD